MKKIILAVSTAIAMFAFCDMAGARSYSENTQYSKHEDMSYDPIGDILGGFGHNFSIVPQYKPHFRHVLNRGHSYGRYHTYSKNYSGVMSKSIVSYGHMLQNMGYRVSEHPAFGGVHHVHHGWAHYAGRAIDINVGRGVVEAKSSYARQFDRLAASARASGYTVLWRVAGHFNHMHIQR